MLIILYDVHGNLDALEAVVADAGPVEGYLLGGDYCVFGPWPRETLERLRELRNATWIRGNGERWLLDPDDRPETEEPLARARSELGSAAVEELFALPESVELDGILFCHGSPLSDVESFGPEPGEADERLLAGERGRTVVFGHSHLQFHRRGPYGTILVNPGSVGMPLDGDRRAAWGLLRDGQIELRRTEYDVERAVARMRALGGFFEGAASRIERGSD